MAVSFQHVALALAPHTFVISCKKLQEFHGLPRSTHQKWCFGTIQDYAGATVMWIRCVEVPKMAFWDGSG
eukprot:4311665-Pyramimonas_sp.AAC.1